MNESQNKTSDDMLSKKAERLSFFERIGKKFTGRQIQDLRNMFELYANGTKNEFEDFRRLIMEADEWRFDDLKKVMLEVDEWRFDDLKRTFTGADEWRFDDLKKTFAEADEWRFRDLKNYLTDDAGRDSTFVLEQSISKISNLGDSGKLAVAVVSVMPPTQTGVANFTAKTFSNSLRPIDIYTPIKSGADYLHQTSKRAYGGKLQNIFALDALPYGIDQRNYAAIVFVIGNSDHHVPVVRALRKLREFSIDAVCCAEIHDSVLLNLCSKVIQFDDRKLSEVLPLHSNKNLTIVDWDKADKGDHGELVEMELTGIRAILNDTPISSLIFHSETARDIVLRDWHDFSVEKTSVLFHPVFEIYKEKETDFWDEVRPLRIGSFGVPGRNKETHMIAEAFLRVSEKYPGARLIIAGYGAAAFAAKEKLLSAPGVQIVDSPSHEKLIELMNDVDVAIQLRAKNTGESSGIIPQLLAHDIPTICSSVGALADFRTAVSYIEPGCDTLTISDIIIEEAQNPKLRSESRKNYVNAHSPAKFCQELFEIFNKDNVGYSENLLLKSSFEDKNHNASESIFNDYVIGESFGESWGKEDPVPGHWARFMEIARGTGAASDPYVRKHLRRYRHTLAAMEKLNFPNNASGLEVGTSWLFAPTMRAVFRFGRVDVTDFLPNDTRKTVTTPLAIPGVDPDYTAFNINLEHDKFPVESDTYDFILCCEVLEHMDIDPMFMLSELNRIGKEGCQILITTPNVTSSRNVSKIMSGYAPHFFMQYHKDRSPYRHNLEYAPDQAAALVEAAGFTVTAIWTANTFEPPAKDMEQFLENYNFPTNMRGDNMFIVAVKEGPVRDRHPPAVYV